MRGALKKLKSKLTWKTGRVERDGLLLPLISTKKEGVGRIIAHREENEKEAATRDSIIPADSRAGKKNAARSRKLLAHWVSRRGNSIKSAKDEKWGLSKRGRLFREDGDALGCVIAFVQGRD